MARDQDAVAITKWGRNAGATHFQSPTDVGFDQADSWPVSYSTVGGDVPPRELFNWEWRGLSALVAEINTRGGTLDHDDAISYVHPAIVFGSDGNLYHSVQDSQGEDPTTDSMATNWQPFPTALASAIVDAIDADLGTTSWRQAPGTPAPTNISISRSSTSVVVQSSTGSNGTIQGANSSNAGVLSSVDKDKLDNIESNATTDQTNSQIKTAYEANSNTNAFTSSNQTKLAGIESGATADQSDSEIVDAVDADLGKHHLAASAWYARPNEHQHPAFDNHRHGAVKHRFRWDYPICRLKRCGRDDGSGQVQVGRD